MTTDPAGVATPPPEPHAAVLNPPASGPLAGVLPWAVVPLYVAGVAVYLVLDARLGGRGLDLGESVPLFVGFGMFAVMGALLIARRPATRSAG